uniref:Dehydrogenase/reductase SDR family member on chromosome X n=1 Tax=Angiostrongylus cantonensis TaxID=6313 RepID=A0A158P7S5_ANGCA
MKAIKGHRRRRELQFAEYLTSWIRLNNNRRTRAVCDWILGMSTVQQEDHRSHQVPRLDILICNAGVLRVPVFTKTVDGFEKTWQCNYLALWHHVFVVKKVNMFDVVNDSKRYGGMIAYSRSKMAQVMYTRHLAKLLEDRNLPVTASVCHPGNVDTNILRESGYSWLSVVFRPIVWFILKTENDGAQMPLYLALSEKSQKSNGQYFRDFAVHEVVEKCKQSVACETLYEESRQAVGLSTLSRRCHQQ